MKQKRGVGVLEIEKSGAHRLDLNNTWRQGALFTFIDLLDGGWHCWSWKKFPFLSIHYIK